MGTGYKSEADAAIQYLTWALEEIEKTGHEKALFHARAALQGLRSVYYPHGALTIKHDTGSTPT
jgi:hypothetical protein